MYIQLLVILLSVIGVMVFSSSRYEIAATANRKKYIIFVCVLLILQSALRNLAIGADTYAYYLTFENMKQITWSEIWEGFRNVYVLGEGKDAGYPLLIKIFQIVFLEYRYFLFFVAILFFSCLGRFLYKNTTRCVDVLIVLCLYQALFYSFFSITGLRQTIASAFTLWAFEYVKQRKLLQFVILIVIASFIHKSALLFLPLYFLAPLRPARWILLGALIAIPLLIPVARNFASILAMLSASENYMGYAESESTTSGAHGFLAFIVSIAVLTLWLLRKSNIHRVWNDPYIINAISIAVIFTPLTWVDPALMRIVQYFSIFSLILLPALINNYTNDNTTKTTIRAFTVLFFVAIIINKHTGYAFMWEQVSLGSNY